MPDPFTIGTPLPRADDAYTTREKLHRYVLASRGHGAEWARVLRAEPRDAIALWLAIAQAVPTAPISAIRDLGVHGVTCEVLMTIALNERSTPTLTAWHYAHSNDAPRLVTAYPRP